ncbi:MAG: S-layer homology domain-containing protein, partial [Clostridia bacterium]|nr:S-layer homology domain-containing protein [Clostridia bacterium]
MRNLKKFLALVLAMLMVVSAAATVSAFEDVAEDNAFAAAIAELNELGIVTGMTEEEFGIDTNVQRIHAAIMFARALTGEVGSNDVWNQGLSQFADVTEYQYAVTVAVMAGIINGVANPDGTITFNPKDNITYIQALKMAVCALGRGDGLAWGTDGIAYYNVADAYGLTAGVNYITDPAKALTRGEFAQIIDNMINAEYYDAEQDAVTTLLKKVFDIPADPEVVIPDTYTTFIITATNEQTAYENMEITEGDIVGMQQLINGVPAEETIYVEIADLGLAEDADVEDYFLNAFDFVNYDAETGAYDAIAPTKGASSWMIFAADISGKSETYNRFTYGGKNYYMVDAKTGDAYKNEVVVYTTKDLGSNETKELYMNKNDQVLHPTKNVPILEKVVSARGNIRYLVLVDDKTADIKAGDYITEAEAIALYGVEIENIELPYSIMDVADLTKNYALVAFDDDGDEKMDRAYYLDVYMAKVAEKIEETYGPIVKGATFAGE